jgi:hypothetical protein
MQPRKGRPAINDQRRNLRRAFPQRIMRIQGMTRSAVIAGDAIPKERRFPANETMPTAIKSQPRILTAIGLSGRLCTRPQLDCCILPTWYSTRKGHPRSRKNPLSQCAIILDSCATWNMAMLIDGVVSECSRTIFAPCMRQKDQALAVFMHHPALE